MADFHINCQASEDNINKLQKNENPSGRLSLPPYPRQPMSNFIFFSDLVIPSRAVERVYRQSRLNSLVR